MHCQHTQKNNRTVDLIGCSIVEYRAYIEKQFKDGMTWDNHGSVWHIDHIIPCDAFDLSDKKQQLKCFHYSNTQPMLAHENKVKWAHYDGEPLQLIDIQ